MDGVAPVSLQKCLLSPSIAIAGFELYFKQKYEYFLKNVQHEIESGYVEIFGILLNNTNR